MIGSRKGARAELPEDDLQQEEKAEQDCVDKVVEGIGIEIGGRI